ncbi:hypothetical protein B0J13DRAFT_646173 [Dactylonectria estremocensis]|uniref:NAD-dependent epimerase/dehydratase domain-containing protein n=1 Tax=Dactylonectria estremocensis TaxID=1079267 RepID=A0A9P9E0Z5_9HYPO|nr:hypothetical protein B0J13DRAFT_646173 [Dactylonectria estremocensis]
MSLNILITGAAGYIGGTLLNTLLAAEQTGILPEQIIAVVRSEEQKRSVSTLGVTVVGLDLSDNEEMIKVILKHNVDIVIHCASAADASLAKPLLLGLKKRMQESGKPAYFVHTSGASSFADTTGWHHGPIKDTDPVYDLMKQITTPYVIRQTDIAVLEYALECNVTTFMVVPPLAYGRGTGECKKSSFSLPTTIRASIANKAVYRFPEGTQWPAVHVVDLAHFYIRLATSIIQGKGLPSGRDGYFFTSAHQVSWHKTLDRIAAVLYARGLVSQPDVKAWPSEDLACQSLGLPPQYVQMGWNSSAVCTSENCQLVGWMPQWDEERFLRDMDDEVQAVLEAST